MGFIVESLQPYNVLLGLNDSLVLQADEKNRYYITNMSDMCCRELIHLNVRPTCGLNHLKFHSTPKFQLVLCWFGSNPDSTLIAILQWLLQLQCLHPVLIFHLLSFVRPFVCPTHKLRVLLSLCTLAAYTHLGKRRQSGNQM